MISNRRIPNWLPLRTLLFVLILASVSNLRAEDESAEPKPLSPQKAADTMVVPKGFHVELFAAEPDVRQPVSFAIDDRGRLWVAEAYNFPFRDKEPQDRIVILEDTTGDGKADKRTLFADKLGYVTGIELGFGGVYVMSPPEMLFIADADGDDRPDAPPKVLLNGFGTNSAHNIANGFTWGPDGWLYAGHGRTSPSDVGPPGTAAKDRIHCDGGVFRYHPITSVFENFCDGSTNPWGVSFNDYGQAFISNCVNPHLFHAIQGAHFEPWRGRKSSQYAFERLPTIADHLHWKGELRGKSNEVLAAGGGHAHCGTMVYLGDNWPDKYRNTVFMGNVHGRRLNNDTLVRKGSGYTASHWPDIMLAKDPWFKAVTIQSGPGGEVYVSDWSDTGECHDYRNTHRETGRLFTISYGDFEKVKINIQALSTAELVRLQLHKNDWWVTHARRVLQERFAAGDDLSFAAGSLKNMFAKHPDQTRKLRALWALHVIGEASESFLAEQLTHENEYVRAWAVRLLSDFKELSPKTVTALEGAVARESSAFVRLHFASAAQRLPTPARWPIVTRLAMRGEDSSDAQLPLMIWYALEPLVALDIERALTIARTTRIEKLRSFIARRAAAGDGAGDPIESLATLLSQPQKSAVQEDLLAGMLASIRGRGDLKTPASWANAKRELAKSSSQKVRELTNQVGLWLHDESALASQRKLVANTRAGTKSRLSALSELLDLRDPQLPPLLISLLNDKSYRAEAIRGLARFEHPEAAKAILKSYPDLSPSEKQDALLTLAARPTYAVALLAAVQRQDVARRDFTSPTVRQLRQHKSPKIQKQLTSIWGVVGNESKDKLAEIARFKKKLQKRELARADASRGRVLYKKTCSSCHSLFGEGGKIGPEITGANRTSIDYLLENILDPNALVPKNYQLTVIQTTQGRVLSGLVVEETEQVLKLQTTNELILLPVDSIESRKLTTESMMPTGLLKDLSDQDLRDLIAYLSSPRQVDPLPECKTEGG